MQTIIYGTGSYSQYIAALLLEQSSEPVIYVDDFNQARENVFSYDQVKQSFLPSKYNFALGIGYKDLNSRMQIIEKIRSDGYSLKTITHPSSYVSPSACLGEGSVVMAHSIIDMNTSVGLGCVIWPNSCINHDCRLGHNIFISPSVTICGFSCIGSSTFIGASSVIVDHAYVPQNSFLKMGTIYKLKSGS